jgi:diguanylate cyclase (GGDEF)-like protein
VRALGRLTLGSDAADEPKTPFQHALIKEQYRALRVQIPIIYLLVVVAVSGLHFAIEGDLSFGANAPTAVGFFAAVRLCQWMRRGDTEPTPVVMWQRMRQTTFLTLVVCVAICGWCLAAAISDPEPLISVLLFGGLTAIGASFGLSSYPSAARIPLLVLAFPLSIAASLSDEPKFIVAAASLAVVSLLLLRVVGSYNRHLESLVGSRAAIELEHSKTDEALQVASTAASTDYLTKLPNRRAFVASLTERLASAKDGPGFCLALFDLDQFKFVNDSFGHSAGDELLNIVAARLSSAAPQIELIARLGGDEFAVILSEVADVHQAGRFGGLILARLNGPAKLDSCSVMVSACCGLTVIETGHEETTSSALKRADIALYAAKEKGPGRYAVFDRMMELPRRRRAAIGRALQSLAPTQGLELAYQPIFDLHTGQVVALEALARWTHPELGVVSPSEFIPAAEQLNLIGKLSDNLFEQALSDALDWSPNLKLAFNLSAVQLGDISCAGNVLRTLERRGYEAQRLQVEVTETAILQNIRTGAANIEQLRSAGVQVVLDDFGAGYSSLSYLRQIQFDLIKLDGSLLASSEHTDPQTSLIAAVIKLCQTVKVPCIAEHIETQGQLQLLRSLGCKLGQGFYLGKPLPAHLARSKREIALENDYRGSASC